MKKRSVRIFYRVASQMLCRSDDKCDQKSKKNSCLIAEVERNGVYLFRNVHFDPVNLPDC